MILCKFKMYKYKAELAIYQILHKSTSDMIFSQAEFSEFQH